MTGVPNNPPMPAVRKKLRRDDISVSSDMRVVGEYAPMGICAYNCESTQALSASFLPQPALGQHQPDNLEGHGTQQRRAWKGDHPGKQYGDHSAPVSLSRGRADAEQGAHRH